MAFQNICKAIMRVDSTPKMEIRIAVLYTRNFMRSVCVYSDFLPVRK